MHFFINNKYNTKLICVFRERKADDEWKDLNKIKLPILLNYAQCKLINGDFYSVIEHCNTVLEYDPGLNIFSLLSFLICSKLV